MARLSSRLRARRSKLSSISRCTTSFSPRTSQPSRRRRDCSTTSCEKRVRLWFSAMCRCHCIPCTKASRGIAETARIRVPGCPAMELRNHPVMFCDGVKVWPPKWLQTDGPGMVSVSGEVGVLEAVFLSEMQINKVYMLMRTEERNRYLGIIHFETAVSAKAVFKFLQNQLHKSIRTIGSLHFPDTLA